MPTPQCLPHSADPTELRRLSPEGKLKSLRVSVERPCEAGVRVLSVLIWSAIVDAVGPVPRVRMFGAPRRQVTQKNER